MHRAGDRRRQGGTTAWIVVAVATVVLAGLVVLFIRNLPGPPRYDELTIEPGSSTPVMRGIVRRVRFSADAEIEVTAANEVLLESWPSTPEGMPASEVVHKVPIFRSDVTFIVLGVESRDVEVIVRRGRSVVMQVDADSAPGDAAGRRESDSLILPEGVSDLEVEFRANGDDPFARVTWRVAEDGEPHRSMVELLDEPAAEDDAGA